MSILKDIISSFFKPVKFNNNNIYVKHTNINHEKTIDKELKTNIVEKEHIQIQNWFTVTLNRPEEVDLSLPLSITIRIPRYNNGPQHIVPGDISNYIDNLSNGTIIRITDDSVLFDNEHINQLSLYMTLIQLNNLFWSTKSDLSYYLDNNGQFDTSKMD